MFDRPDHDPAVAAAERAVTIARDHLRAVQRDHLTGWRGATDVHKAEVALHRALDLLAWERQHAA